jgi:hypothetical protein
MPSISKTLGDLSSHKLAIRNICISDNDRLIATSSFDSVKVWQVDFSSQSEQLNVSIQNSFSCDHALSLIIITGNKYVVVGTK